MSEKPGSVCRCGGKEVCDWPAGLGLAGLISGWLLFDQRGLPPPLVFQNCIGRVCCRLGIFFSKVTTEHPKSFHFWPYKQAPRGDILSSLTPTGAVFSRVSIGFAHQLLGNNSSISTESRIQVFKQNKIGGGGRRGFCFLRKWG